MAQSACIGEVGMSLGPNIEPPPRLLTPHSHLGTATSCTFDTFFAIVSSPSTKLAQHAQLFLYPTAVRYAVLAHHSNHPGSGFRFIVSCFGVCRVGGRRLLCASPECGKVEYHHYRSGEAESYLHLPTYQPKDFIARGRIDIILTRL